MKRTLADGPALHFRVPSRSSVAVGIVIEGPRPQIAKPGFAGEKINVVLISPNPNVSPPVIPAGSSGKPLTRSGTYMRGTIVRVMRF